MSDLAEMIRAARDTIFSLPLGTVERKEALGKFTLLMFDYTPTILAGLAALDKLNRLRELLELRDVKSNLDTLLQDQEEIRRLLTPTEEPTQ